ncbi:heavy metal translocatin [Patellaria atrata CBS 101060]|uniref:Heavy metal translocatin n=1 Tax=Patellaria atrata CBS 101060 TaxID=1346257 RepID=A0A9P4S907_9PEZI|nr:heavy metal translocatin [Patellaria atrata CBS 101060]
MADISQANACKGLSSSVSCCDPQTGNCSSLSERPRRYGATSEETDKDRDGGSCVTSPSCSSKIMTNPMSKICGQDGGKQQEQNNSSCMSRCCSQSDPRYQPTIDEKSRTSCCNSKGKQIRSTPINDGCCQEDERHKNVNGSGCCDDTCLDKVALRECRNACGSRTWTGVTENLESTPTSSTAPEYPQPPHTSSYVPCDFHISTIRSQYQSSLDAFGCLCRALLAHGLETCCSSLPRGSTELLRRTSKSFTSIRSQSRSPSTCSTMSQGNPKRSHHHHHTVTGSRFYQLLQDTKISPFTGNRHGVTRAASVQSNSSSSISCCAKDTCANVTDKCCTQGEVPSHDNDSSTNKEDTLVARSDAEDPERGPAQVEHIILSVQGMTCSGCEKQLLNAMSTIKGLANMKSSLVLARVEFDLDVSLLPLDELITKLGKKTAFYYEKIDPSHGQTFDILVDNPCEFCHKDLPPGVTHLQPIDKCTVRVHYDALDIGVRDLVRGGFDDAITLAPLPPHPSITAGRRQVRKEGLLFLVSAILTVPVLVLAWAPLPKDYEMAYESASLGLATIIQALVVWIFYPSAFKSLVHSKVIEVDMLIVLSTTAAYTFSIVAFVYYVLKEPLSTGTFFETSTLLVTLILLGRFMSEFARQRATESVSIRSLQPTTALVLSRDRSTVEEIDSRLLQYGDVFRIPPDTRIVTDGNVIYGESEVDESMVTGESALIAKGISSQVIAGSINRSGTLDVGLTKLPWENTIATIAAMVDDAELTKPKSEAIANKVAGYFVPVIVSVTIIVFIIWTLVGRFAQDKGTGDAAVRALTYAIATLIVSCPCAIGLAVPMVVVIATGVAAKHGVILKVTQSIETARNITHVVFDKTGTLTDSIITVVSEEYPEGAAIRTKSAILGLLENINHPVSIAIAKHLRDQKVANSTVDRITAIPGQGVEGHLGDLTIRAGNSRWLGLDLDPIVRTSLADNRTVFCVMLDNQLCAVYGLKNTLRPDAKSIVQALHKRSMVVSMISGDDDGAVQDVARQLGLPAHLTKSRASPADKRAYIQTIQKNNGVVIFVGDGTNDSIALAQADVGCHMNEGHTDVASSAADVVFMKPHLASVLVLLDLSKAAVFRIYGNFAWAATYNLIAVLAAAGALVKFRIPPAYAGLGEIVSVVPVILIAFLLKFGSFGTIEDNRV